MKMPKEIEALVKELTLIGDDKITQPNGANRRAAKRAARIIRDLYKSNDKLEMEESSLDSE